ncbi:MerR family transcriptional regulator [Brachybacterium sp. AOP35-5H-19]|uniref:MerR family transcriptional regulator n=1 Tax=Brachybacterium sp. AOP35-5H-19 TaxID=3457685 RepID=UPI0040340B07
MSDEQLLTISTFARAVGVPASALRHYAAEQVFVPADVDPVSGYRYYAPSQIEGGVLLRRMRAIGVPLAVMREVVAGPASEASRLLAELLMDHGTNSRRREQELHALREHLDPTTGATGSVRATVPGASLAAAITQVLPVAERAADDVSGLIWVIESAEIALIATDRYWLAHRRLRAEASGSPGRAIISVAGASKLARACTRRGDVHLSLTGEALTVHDVEGTLLSHTALIERAVPDLGLLVSSQPPARAVAGFARTDLQDLLVSTGQSAPLRLVVEGSTAILHAGEAPSLHGWASCDAGSEGGLEVLMGRALLAAAVSACTGEEMTLSLVDPSTPVRVTTPIQDTLTCLVMPMRP